MAIEPDGVPARVVGEVGEQHAGEGEEEADRGADVLEQHDRQLGLLGACGSTATTSRAASPLRWLASLYAVRSENVSSTMAKSEDADGDAEALDLVRVAQLLDALVEGEQAAHREQHEGDDERPEVALAAVAERVLDVGALRAPACRRAAAAAWLPVSAREWTASASRPAELVIRKPTNLAMAMPRLAKKAARMACRLPSVTGPGCHRSAPSEYLGSSEYVARARPARRTRMHRILGR